jgi:hypothetical protein
LSRKYDSQRQQERSIKDGIEYGVHKRNTQEDIDLIEENEIQELGQEHDQ